LIDWRLDDAVDGRLVVATGQVLGKIATVDDLVGAERASEKNFNVHIL
jgi:hypothetical protein